MDKSLLNYSVVAFASAIGGSGIRLFWPWATDSLFHLTLYYISTGFVFSLSIFIFMQYRWLSGHFQRPELNKVKGKSYNQLVLEKYNLKYNFLFAKYALIVFGCDCIFTNFYKDNHTEETSLLGELIHLLLLVDTVNPETKGYAHQLTRWDIDPTQFKIGESNLLSEELIKEAHKGENSRRYPKPPLPIPAELTELVEKTESRTLEQEKRHSLEIEKLNNEMEKLKNQAVYLEDSKEIDLN